MSQEIIINYEYIGVHIKDYMNDYRFFNIFDIDVIKIILKHSNLTLFDFNRLLENSASSIKANQLYNCIRGTNVDVHTYQDAISALKSIHKHLKLSILNGIISILDNTEKEMSQTIEKQHDEINNITSQTQSPEKEIQSLNP